MTTDEDGEAIVVGGFEYQIFDVISRKLKYVMCLILCIIKLNSFIFSFRFKYDISLPKLCCMWGGPLGDKNNNYTGLVGDLFNGYSDIGWANLFVNQKRAKMMDYTDAYAVDYLAWMVNITNIFIKDSFICLYFRPKNLIHCHCG